MTHAIAGIKLADLKPNRQNLRYQIGKIRRALRRYLRWRHSWLTTSVGVLVVCLLILLTLNLHHTAAASAVMVPDSDVTTGWSPSPSGSHYTTVDDGTADNTSDYVFVLSSNTTASVTDKYTLTSPASVASASQVVLRIYMEAMTNANGGAMDTISLNLIVNGTAQTATTCTPTYMIWTACTGTYSGSWTQSDVDSMQVSIVRNIQGSGKASSQPDEVHVANVYDTLTFVSSIQYTQSAYRWFTNQDASTSAATSLNFDMQVGTSVGATPIYMANADFNGDGNLDLVSVNETANTVSILLGNGDGTFQPKTDYATGSDPRTVSIADFNNDGKLDLAVSNFQDNTVSILLGNGDGTFQPKTDHALTTTSNVISNVTADFNDDGNTDLAVVYSSTSVVSILLGNGDGTFQPPVDYPTGGGAYSVISADFNDDQKLDLAVSTSSDTVSILLGNGDGSFGANNDFPTGSRPQSMAVADFNGDGKQDMAAACENSSTVCVLLGNGDGTFQPHVDYPTATLPAAIAAADFNRDGKADLITSNENTPPEASIFLGNGDGTFQPKVGYTIGSSSDALTVGDFNNDGLPDFITASSGTNATTAYLNASLPPPIDVKSPLTGAQDTAATAPNEGTIFRLRLDLHVTGAQATPGLPQFRLQFAPETGYLTCSAVPTGSYGNVSNSSTGIRWANNPNGVSGMGLVANASDPLHGTDTNIDQTYQEKGTTTFTNTNSISIGQDGMWDFGLVTYHSFQNTTYCFRVANADGSAISTYNVYPEITTPAATFTQASYRWYNSDPWGTTQTFAKSYGSLSNGAINDMVMNSDGTFVAVGSANSPAGGSYRAAAITKFDSSGNVIWSTSWGGTGTVGGTAAKAVATTSDGGYIIVGNTADYTTNFNEDDAFIAKFTGNGVLVWSQVWANKSLMDNTLYDVIQDSSGNFVVAGEYTDLDKYSSPVSHGFIAKYSPTGTLLSTNMLNESGTSIDSLISTSDGGYLVAANQGIVKLTSSLAVSWAQKYVNGSTPMSAYKLIPITNGYAAVGYGGEVWTMDTAGNVIWKTKITTSSSPNLYAIQQTTDGGYIAVGSQEIFKLDAAGNVTWNRSFNSSSDNLYAVLQMSDGGYMVGGTTNSGGLMLLVKLDAAGNISGCGSYCTTPSLSTDKTLPTTSALSITVGSPSGSATTPPSPSSVSLTLTTTIIVAVAMPTGTAFAPLNTPLDLSTLTTLNLRVAVRVDGSGIDTGSQSFQLQYALRGGATSCSAVSASSYSPVTTSTTLQYFDDSAHASGEQIADQINDPSDGSRTIDPQTYQEQNNFANSQSPIYAGEDGMWQFALTINNTSLKGKDFCVRVAAQSGGIYSPIPALNTADVAYAPTMPELLHGGNWFSRTTGTKQWLSL